MREYLRHYERPSPWALFNFALDLAREHSNLRRQSLWNRIRDYPGAASNSKRLDLHHRLQVILSDNVKSGVSYDYGEGYFYQGSSELGITGLRDTDARVHIMNLMGIVSGRDVLDIGCNVGFLANRLAGEAASVTGVEFNPYLVACANEAARYLKRRNLDALATSFEDFVTKRQFDVVLSLANHSTYDGNTQFSLHEYFLKCRDLLRPGGVFVFESHAPEHEGNQMETIHPMIEGLFSVREVRTLVYGTFLDRGRTMIIATT
jgi:SAM-dependent methyltransferase